MRKYVPEFGLGYFGKLLFFFAVYSLSAQLGLHIYAVHHFAALIWPPTGIALAILILYGYNLWPAVTVGAFVVNLLAGANPILALFIALGNSLEAVLGTYFIRRMITIYRCFERVGDTIRFIAIVTLIPILSSATIGVLSIWLGHVIIFSQIPNTWLAWWIGDTLGALVVAPFLIVTLRPTRRWNFADRTSWEIIGGYLLLVFTLWLIFWHGAGSVAQSPLLYLILFPFLWAGIRFGTRGMTMFIFLTSLFATVSTIFGHGPFVMAPLRNEFLSLQVFVGTLSVTFLIFEAVVKERNLNTEKLAEHVDELEKAMVKISDADKAKNDFLAILAHELRNPLAPVLSSIEIMKMKNTEKPELIETMENHVHTLAHLLDDLLDISRISRKKFKLDKQTFHLQKILGQSIEAAEPMIREKRHHFVSNIPSEPIWLVGDPLRIEQILVNLLVNAAKYTEPEGNITLDVRTEENTLIISVTDTGIGIASDHLFQIFEPFLQLHKDASGQNSGLGIGLGLSKKLVELHDGNITAKSNGLGLGSQFIVTIPIPQNIQLPLNIDHAQEQKAKKYYKILVVDDNVPAAEGLGELLRYGGHTVELTHDGRATLEKIKSFYADVVVLDIGLPEMSGYDVARRIREIINRRIILIALTGYGQESDKAKAKKAGFNYHLTKPVSISDIEHILAEL